MWTSTDDHSGGGTGSCSPCWWDGGTNKQVEWFEVQIMAYCASSFVDCLEGSGVAYYAQTAQRALFTNYRTGTKHFSYEESTTAIPQPPEEGKPYLLAMVEAGSSGRWCGGLFEWGASRWAHWDCMAGIHLERGHGTHAGAEISRQDGLVRIDRTWLLDPQYIVGGSAQSWPDYCDNKGNGNPPHIFKTPNHHCVHTNPHPSWTCNDFTLAQTASCPIP